MKRILATLRDEEGRQRARDADNALAELSAAETSKQTELAQVELEKASRSDQSSSPADQQSNALSQAADSQSQLAQQLQELGQKLANQEEGRAELRANEAENPIGESLAEGYQEAEELADQLQTAQSDPSKVLAALEAELEKNPAMQEALREIEESAAKEAVARLQQADAREARLDETLQKLAEDKKDTPRSAERQQSAINKDVSRASETMARASRHASRLGEMQSAKSLGDAAKDAGKAAARELAQARDALSNDSAANDSTGKVSDASERLHNVAQAAEAAQAKAGEASSKPTRNQGSPDQQAKGRALAQALDQLDQALNQSPSASASQARSAQTPSPGEASTAQAKESLAEAIQSLANAMAGSRQTQSQQQHSPASPSSNQSDSAERTAAQQPTTGKSQFGKREDQSVAEDARAQDFVGSDPRRWGDLPHRMAEEVLQSRNDTVAPEYRQSIENYYKALSDRSWEQK